MFPATAELPGGEEYIRYHLPQERGWAYAHAELLASGLPMIWPRREDNKQGRWWNWMLGAFGRLRQALTLPPAQ